MCFVQAFQQMCFSVLLILLYLIKAHCCILGLGEIVSPHIFFSLAVFWFELQLNGGGNKRRTRFNAQFIQASCRSRGRVKEKHE